MIHAELKEARRALGLTQAQMARMLDTDSRSVRRLESHPDSLQHRTPAPRMMRLIQAYLAGFRPPDWPARRALNTKKPAAPGG